MKLQDTQYTADELALMNGDDISDVADRLESQNDDEAGLKSGAIKESKGDGDEQDPSLTAEQIDAETVAPKVDQPAEQEAPEPFIPKFDATGPENYAEAKAALRQEKIEARQKWGTGDLSDDEFAKVEAAIDDRIEALQAEYLTAQALARANQQIQAQQQRETLAGIAAAAKRDGIDYADEALAIVYDTKLKAVKADEAFKGKSFAEIAQEAHARVAKLFGKGTTPATGTPADGTKPNARANLPQTLGNLPAAAAPVLGDDLSQQFDAIDDPDLAEARWASMTAAQRNAMLRASLPARR